MFKHLLVPVDRSRASEESLEYAVSIALAADATLELVLVRERPLATELPYPTQLNDQSGDEEYLHQLAKRALLAGLSNTSYTVLDGGPAEAVCAHAKRTGADFIVMTSHFRTGIARAWAGSVADQVVRGSEIPVLMIRVAHRPPTPILMPVGFQRILVPLDGSAAAAAVLPSVRALATCTRAEVLLLRIVQPATLAMSTLSTPGSVAQMSMAPTQADFDVVAQATKQLLQDASDELDSVAAQLRAEGLYRVSWHVEIDDRISDGITAFAAARDVSLIAMSTRGRGASRVVLGSVADAVLRTTGLPVLLECPLQTLAAHPHLTDAGMECQLPGLVA